MKLQSKILLIWIIPLLFLVLISSLVIIYYSGNNITQLIKNQVHSVNVLKENQFLRFERDAVTDIERIAKNTYLVDYLIKFHKVESGSILDAKEEEEHIAEELVEDSLNFELGKDSKFFEIYIITLDGTIDLSTNLSNEGKIKSDRKYFIEGLKGTYVENFYFSISLNSIGSTITTPIIAENGNMLGVLAGRLKIEEINKIMLERSGLGNTGETLLVNKFNFAVTDLKKEPGSVLKKTLFTNAVKNCLAGNTGFINDKDYFGDSAFIGYHWLKEQEICLISKIDREEALAPLKQMIITLLIILFSLIIISLYISWLYLKSVTSPLSTLKEAANKIAHGELEFGIKIKTNDEIGELADSFEMMRQKVNYSHHKLEEEVKEKTVTLNDKISELESNKIALINMMEDLNQSMEEQKQLEKIKTEFLSVTSHELRTPITPMKAQLQMVLAEYFGNLTEQQKKSLNMVLTNANRLDRLIGDILDISKLQSGNMKFQMGMASLGTLLECVVETMNFKANEKNVNILLHKEDMHDIFIDKDRVTQVVINLVNNAIKFTDPGGKITVEMKKDDNKATIKVIDSGIGISKDDQIRLFHPFVQVDSSMSRNFEGSGLGLAICKGIVTHHCGDIWIESELGKGSTFAFTLPFIIDNNNNNNKEVELFKYDENSILLSFIKEIAKQGYKLTSDQEKIKNFIRQGMIKEDGSLRYDVSLDDLEKAGYLEKEKKENG